MPDMRWGSVRKPEPTFVRVSSGSTGRITRLRSYRRKRVLGDASSTAQLPSLRDVELLPCYDFPGCLAFALRRRLGFSSSARRSSSSSCRSASTISLCRRGPAAQRCSWSLPVASQNALMKNAGNLALLWHSEVQSSSIRRESEPGCPRDFPISSAICSRPSRDCLIRKLKSSLSSLSCNPILGSQFGIYILLKPV